MGKSSSPPPAPDYAGAAQATAAGNLEAAKYATAANRVNQYTPYGSLTYNQIQDPNYSPGDPRSQNTWESTISLSPVGQQLLDYANSSALGLGAETGQALGRVDQSLSQPFDINSANDAVNKAYGNITSRLDPQWNTRADQMNTTLVNQGLRPGMEAYDNAMRDFNNARNDAYTQANTAAMNYAPQTMQLDLAARNQALNELNALRTGSQVTNPTFGSVPQQQQTTGPNMLGAAQASGQYNQGLYNADVASNNAMTSGLFSLGAAAIPFFSDRRLKSNIVQIGTHPLGIGVYEYDIFGGREVGVMADEVLTVMPEAVSVHPSGFMQVDYGRL